ncbi:hypothetical protein ACFOMD_09030 [Sphingoaurantiacus capsulatus]|uniref:Uncharacterized protein n=1 Tax=Sphingoaurantiacus capsulatus TaxID=1771310 RepID=A0ABV7X9C5_9SPHN
MKRSAGDIDKLIVEWESLRAEYASRGSTGIVDFISAELRKLRLERAELDGD